MTNMLTLYKVDGRGRVNLSGLVPDGVEFYTAEPDTDGTITLSPVKVATTSATRTGQDTPTADDADDTPPFTS